MASSGPRAGSVRSKLVVNTILAASFVALLLPSVTRIAIHEWLSIAFCLVVALHLLFSWNWIANVSRRLLATLRGEVRFNYAWDFLLYFTLAVVMVSGLLVSEAVLPAIGFPRYRDRFWTVTHAISSDVMIVMVGVHLAMHWEWVTTAVRRFAGGTLTRPAPRANGASWWIRPIAFIAVVAVVLSGLSLTLGATPMATRIRREAEARRAARAAAPAPAVSGAGAGGSAADGPAVPSAGQSAAAPKEGPRPPRLARIPLRTHLLRGGRTLAVYMGLPFLLTLVVLRVARRSRATRQAHPADPLDESGE